MKYWLPLGIFFCFLPLQTWAASGSTVPSSVTYVALGDSYTKGQGIDSRFAWPVLLTERLKEMGLSIELSANLGESGARVKNVLDRQLPQVLKHRPTFVTVLIGVNDWVHSAAGRRFAYRFQKLIKKVQEDLPNPHHVLIVTLPDFSCSPTGSQFGYGKSAPNGMKRFNRLIQKVADEKQLKVVDVFSLSQKACADPEMFSPDGLHPSQAQYNLWVDQLAPVAYDLLKPSS